MLALLLLSLINILSFTFSETIQLYISPNGDDSNNGTSPQEPLRTLEYTKNTIRSRNNNQTQFIVNLMEGTFYLNQSLDFLPQDSGLSPINNTIYSSFNKSSPSIISGGFHVPYSCFKQISSKGNYNIYQCNTSSFKSLLRKPNFRSLRIGNKRATPSRFPKLLPTDDPYLDGWLFINSSEYLGDSTYLIGIDTLKLSPQLRVANAFKQGKIHIFPRRSWINIEMNVQPATGMNASYFTYFKVQCPIQDDHHCTNTTLASEITAGNRFYFYDITTNVIPIEQEYEWYYNQTTNILYLAATDNDIKTVVIPNTDYIIRFLGEVDMVKNMTISAVRNITLKNIMFKDSDYTAYGFQYGFNTLPYQGVPSDGAIRTSGGNNIIIQNCSFVQLAGGGIVISNKSEKILISNNIFSHVGQSGVALVGNGTSQARLVTITNNSFEYIGDILASAGGIYGSSVSDSIFRFNNISNGSRWGIAIRSNGGQAMSYNNLIEYNRIDMVGMKTRDFGGISLIGNKYTGSRIIHNCIKNVIGTDTNLYGEFIRPFVSFGVYLDNLASGYYIYGNIAHNNVLCGCHIHGGQGNYITNNIWFNSSEITPPPGQYGHGGMGQINLYPDTTTIQPYNNTILRNVYYYYNKTAWLVHTNTAWNVSWFTDIDYNLYYNPNIEIKNVSIKQFTPAGDTWNDWIMAYNKRYDQNSLIDTDPMFKDVNNGNFEINPSSLLISKLKFQPIPSYIAQC